MDIKAAGHVAKQMAQFFKVFKDVEDVLEAAAQAENLKGEIARQIENLTADRIKAEGEVREVKAGLAVARAEYERTKANQEAALASQRESAARAASARQAEVDGALKVTQDALHKAQNDFADYCKKAADERDELERNIKALQKHLDGLKAKVAAL